VKMGVRTKIILLYALGIIEPKSFQNIIQIIKVRNESIVHSQDMNKIWEEKNLSSITQNLEVILSCIKTLGKLDSTSKSRGIMKLWNC
jgi:DNA-binding MltR family transcriptional regulator